MSIVGHDTALAPLPLPAGIRSNHVDGVNGMRVHVLEAGTPGQPSLLMLHGFPELAFSWRELMVPLAAYGYHVVAPDQRGYGRSTGFSRDYDTDLRPFGMNGLVKDACALLDGMGTERVACVVGHDLGSHVAAWCTLQHPERFAALVMMSAPFGGQLSAHALAQAAEMHAQLAALPTPRKHYQLHFSSREANAEMWHSPQGIEAFLRAYFHMKSADWPGNHPAPLAGWSADELAELPEYYVMQQGLGMAETVARHMPDEAQIDACQWLPRDQLAVYAAEFARTGFQAALNWYRGLVHPDCLRELLPYVGRTIDVPSCFISGAADWGPYQRPGELERMAQICPQLSGVRLIPGAGHWLQQEKPEATLQLLNDFLRD